MDKSCRAIVVIKITGDNNSIKYSINKKIAATDYYTLLSEINSFCDNTLNNGINTVLRDGTIVYYPPSRIWELCTDVNNTDPKFIDWLKKSKSDDGLFEML
jgi:hypothetical protein